MAVEDINDKKIKNLLETNYPMDLIHIDFQDLNNMNLVIKNSFPKTYKLIKNERDDNWYYVARLNISYNCIDIIGILNFELVDNKVKISDLEISEIFKKQGITEEPVIIYLKKYAKFTYKKEIIYLAKKNENIKFLKDFEKKEGSLEYKWNVC